MTNLYIQNYETLMKEIEEDTNKWKDTLCSWVRRINIIKISGLGVVAHACNPSSLGGQGRRLT